MGIVWIIVIGLIAGLIARAILPGGNATEAVMTLALGIVGSFAGGLFMGRVTNNAAIRTSAFQPAALIGSVSGALLVLGVWHLVRRRRAG